MKSKFSYKSKRTIIIAAIITVLLAGTATGVYFFTKGNAQAQAAGDNNTTQEQYGEAPEENKNEQQNNTTENEQNKNEQGETTLNQQEEQETERQEQTTNNNQTTQNEQTTTTTTGEVPNQEYVTEREETVKNPWETLEVGWGPTQFASIASTANLTAKKSNLEIHKTVDKESVKIGDTLTYTISVKNNGDKVAKAIIYDNVPEGTVLLNKDNNEDENTKKLTWRVTVEPGETEKVEFTVRVKAEKGTIKNSAIINGKTTNETETGIINITGKKEVNTSEAKVGDTLTYTITLTNSGNATGTVTVTDEIPAGTTLVEKSITNNGVESNGTITWTDVEVKAGDTVEVSFKVTINSDTKTSVTNKAVIDGNKPTEEVETRIANITGAKSVDKSTAKVGDTLTYTIILTNSGNADGTVTVTDEIPTGTTLVADSITANGSYNEENKTITWTDVKVEAGKTAEVSFKVTINNDTKTSVTNKAVIDGNKPTEEVETRIANITGAKSVDKSTAKVGDTLTYTITLTNSGNADGKVTVTDEIPTGTRIKDENTTGYNKETNTMTWSDVEVKAGKSVELTLEVVVKDDTTDTVKNVAKIDNKEIPEKPETKVANITGAKSVDKPTAKVGDILTYTIKLTNSGNGDGKVTVTDEIPTGTRIKDENTTGYNKETNTMTWSDVEVKAGKSVELTLEVVVKDDTTDTVKNVAKIDNKEIPEKPETTVANITGTKTVDKAEAKVGDTLTYTITLTNSGNADGTVTVTDEIPTGTRIKDENTTGYNKATNTMIWSDVEVKAGKSVELTLEVVVEDNTSVIKNKAYVDDNKILEEPETAVKHHYTVEHYTENLDGTYSKVEKDTVVSEDVEIGTKVTYEANKYDGFTFDDSKTENKDATVPDNNNLVVKLYYTRRNDLNYTVYYKEQGTENKLADAKVVDGKTFGDVVTENAIDIDGYNKVNPTSAEITITTGTNEYTFYYTKRADLSYTVYYKEQGTENELADAKVVDGKTFGDVVTENAIDIDGYNKVNPTSAEITITTGTNEYTFYYTKRADLSYTVYYKEQGTENELADAKVVDGKTFGDVVTENAIDIDGYNKVNPTSAEITITTGTNEYTFYYTKRADLSYTVYYKEQGTETKLAEAKVVNNKTFEEVITASIKAEDNATEKPKTIDGYECVEVKPGELSIGTGENVITFYYVKLCQYKIEYYLNGNLAEQYTVGPEKIRVGTTIGFETKTEELEKIDSAISGYKYIKYVGVDGKDNEGTTAYKDMNVIKVYYGLPVTSIEKTATEFVNAGDEIEYTIEVSNTGDWKTTITVTDTLEETEYVNGSSNITPSIDGKTLSWSIELEARGSKTISFRAKTNNESYGDEISNTAKIKGTNKEDTAVTRVNEIDVTYSEWLEGQKGTDLNIVFVLDNSSSMNFPIAGKTYVKDELNRKGSHVTPIAPSDKNKTRIENAKSAINSFIDSQANNKNTTMEVVTFNKSEKGTAKNMMTLMDIPDKDIQYRENLWGGYYYIEINGIECRVEKDVIGTDGKKHCGVYIPIDYGARLVGDNSVSNDILKKNVSEISISSEQNGFGTYVEPAFKLINDNKEKQYLKDGKKNIIIVLADGKFSDNNSYNGELKTLKDTLETNGGEIYCVGFGSGTEYDSTALAKMSTNNKCYEAKDASTLLTKFNEILASVGKTQSGRTQNGKITFEEAKNTIKVSEECPIVATYGDSENETVLFTCTSDNADEMWNKYGLKIDGKIISWDAKQFAIANEGIKVPNNIKIKYYIARQ